ncbi:MAG: protease HtpX [Gammaproteobacteria bacterium]|nr:protease HtpX [Gammaproteobacteria bacterium]MCP5198920.1 protease HtpX [Gammaproteobacteria bacterium]
MLRIGLFLATNFAVLFVLSIVMKVLGLDQPGSGTGGMLVFAAIFGMGGSLISLLMSKTMAARAVGAQVIEQPSNAAERWLLATVERQAAAAGIGMPEVAVFDSPSPNAFATGANRDAALVAVSTGLLRQMSEDEVEAVLGHEISHVANGDMVTLALVQGVLNTFVMVFAHVLAAAIDRDGRGRHGAGYYLGYFAAQAVLGFLASLIVMWFSRFREYRADAGGARLAGRGKMIAALERLKAQSDPQGLPDSMAAFGISGGLGSLLSTHPPLEARIARLRAEA